MEGIMMVGPKRTVAAFCDEEGNISTEEISVPRLTKQYPLLGKPFIRGIFNFGSSLANGVKALMFSAEFYPEDGEEPEETSKFEQWLDDKLGDKLGPIITAISMVLGVGLAILLFMYLPSLVSKFISKFVHLSAFGKNLIEGILKIAIFIGYTALTALTKDIRRTYEYHGAEHKTIACYEHEEELTVENVKKYTRFHPRCGTSFIFLVLFISIFVNTIFRVSWASILLRVVIKIALLPIVTGIAYELIRLAGKYDNIFTKIISAPGLWIQRITTSEPDESQIECAIAALKACIPENKEDDKW